MRTVWTPCSLSPHSREGHHSWRAVLQKSQLDSILPDELTFCNTAFLIYLSFWFDPNPALVHQVNLLLNDLLMVFSVLHRLTIQIQILGIDRLLINYLVEFGAQILHPVIPLCACAMISEGFNVNDTPNVG